MSDPPAPAPSAAQDRPGDDLVRLFVEHWGAMARLWGINATMAELFALMFLTGQDWSAEALRQRLRISRGNVSMNLRELLAWGVIRKVHRQGERREFFRAESDIGILLRRIVAERKRRELDPTLRLLEGTAARLDREGGPELGPIRERARALGRLFALIDGLAGRLLALEPKELEELLGRLDELRAPGRPAPSPP
jgi:DNA-binding transcriptional regulator GbsR (MarR family)